MLAGWILLSAAAVSPALSQDSASADRLTHAEIQAAVMSFADTWAARIYEAADKVAKRAGTAEARSHADRFKFYGATAAIDIASHPNAGVNLLDMLVLASLNRTVWEDYWGPKVYGPAANPMTDVLRTMEAEIWDFAGKVLTPTQLQEVKEVLRQWRAKNPNKQGVHFIRFSDFGEIGRKPSLEAARQPGGLLAPVREAAEAAEEIKIWGDRALYLMVRMQELTILRLEIAMRGVLQTPELSQTLEDISGFRNSLERYADVLETLPVQLPAQAQSLISHSVKQMSIERQAAINQLLLGIAQERQLAMEQMIEGVTQVREDSIHHLLEGASGERQALIRDLERLIRRGELEVEAMTTHLFVLSAALLLLYFLLRMIYRHTTDHTAATWYGKFAPAPVLVIATVSVIGAALIYVHHTSPGQILANESTTVVSAETHGDMGFQSPRSPAVSQPAAAGKIVRGSETDRALALQPSETHPVLSRDRALLPDDTVTLGTPSHTRQELSAFSALDVADDKNGSKKAPPQALPLNQEIVVLQVMFARARTEITPAFYPSLNDVSEILLHNPELRCEIRGHADGLGVSSANLELSEERAKTIARYLIQRGIAPERLWVLAYGSTKPVASNGTVEGRAKNRRVEIRVIH